MPNVPETSQCVLLLSDDADVQKTAQHSLTPGNIDFLAFSDVKSAHERLCNGWPGIVIADSQMPGLNATEFLSEVAKIDPELPVLLINADSVHSETVRMNKRDGAFEVLLAQCSHDQFIASINRALRHRALVTENRMLRRELARHTTTAPEIIGNSPAMEKLRAQMVKAAASHAHVLIHGESGSGKEVIARNLHATSGRPGPFVVVHCAEPPEHLMDAELFGTGPATPGAPDSNLIGKLDLADTGTLFLDEVETLPLALQVKLLRVLQERSGPNPLRTNPIDLRIIAATKIDLRAASAHGAFREDLYYRLNVIELGVPPLRDRPDDIALLFDHFTNDAAKRWGRTVDALSPSEIAEIKAHDWPGNIRALRHAAERRVLGFDSLPTPITAGMNKGASDGLPLPQQVESFEKGLITDALREHGGNVTATVTALGLPRKTFYDKLTKYGIIPAEFRRQRKA